MKRKRRDPVTGRKVPGSGRRLRDLAITRGNVRLRPGAATLSARKMAGGRD